MLFSTVTRRLSAGRNFTNLLSPRIVSVSRDNEVLDSHRFFRLTNPERTVYNVAQSTWVTSKDESREMMALWPDVVRDLTDPLRNADPDVAKWMIKTLQYNVPGGKKSRALALVFTYRMLARPDQLTPENLQLARILGWCIELLQAYLLVLDDIQDHAETRRNQPCWYKQNDIGLRAINDGLLLESSVYHLLYMHFKDKDCYMDLVEQMREVNYMTVIGQCLDMISTTFNNNKPNLNLYTMDRYNAIVKYKTAYYSYVLPVTLAMYFVGIRDPEMHRQAKTILLEIGQLFQVQDDYLDCFGNSEETGKEGTDIAEGKCSWLVVVALQRATPEQRKLLEECYGQKDPEKVKKVERLYNELGLQNTYSIYEEETYNLLNTHIQQISRGLPHDLFLKLLNKMYKRKA